MADAVILPGDCIENLKELPDSSVDAVVTDPPYELGFMGKKWDGTGIAYSHDLWAEVLRVLKPGGHLLAFGGTRTYHRMTVAIEDAGFEVRDCLQWLYGSGFPKSLDVSKAVDKHLGAERPIAGVNPRARQQTGKEGTSGYGDFRGAPEYITAPATPEAAQWNGWGTALKPAYEPIVVARKPLVGTVAANVLEHGTGALNIDGCRIGTDGGGTRCDNRDENGQCRGHKNAGRSTSGETVHGPETSGGRWPANVLLDEEAAALLDAQTGTLKSGSRKEGEYGLMGYRGAEPKAMPAVIGDSGGASRFFYCAKASKKDRGEDNTHPTVKPNALMRYLVRLVTPPGGIVLDPFAGSGSTGVAAVQEGFNFIGFEREEEYVQIAESRINKVLS